MQMQQLFFCLVDCFRIGPFINVVDIEAAATSQRVPQFI